MKLLVTGGAGFIGSNFVHRTLAKHPEWKLVVLDKLTYAGNLKNLEPELGEGRCAFVQMDICDRGVLEQVRGCDAVIHFAAESHVDRSIEDASAFVRTNVDGTHNMLQACREAGVPRFVHVSTDEVYGSLGDEGPVFRRHAAAAQESVLGDQGVVRSAGAGLRAYLQVSRPGDALLQ